MKRAMPVIDYQDVRLRPLAEADLPMTLEWRNRERSRVWFKNSQTLTLEQHRGWFAKYAARDDEFMFVIEEKSSGKPIGQVGLYGLDVVKRETEGGRLMAAPTGVTLGLMSQAVKAICDWGLRCLPIDRVYCEVFASNIACLRAIRRADFRPVSEAVHPRGDSELVLLELPASIGRRADSNLVEAACSQS